MNLMPFVRCLIYHLEPLIERLTFNFSLSETPLQNAGYMRILFSTLAQLPHNQM